MTVALHVDQQRAEGMLGASSAACALGMDRYRSPISLWRELRGMESSGDDRPAAVMEAAECGQLLEPIVRGRYALKTNRHVFVPRWSYVKDGWLRATPDGISIPGIPRGASVEYTSALASPVVIRVEEMPSELDIIDPDWKRDAGLLQCKTASAWKRDEWEHGVPAAYEIQMRVEMAVCDLPWNDAYCLLGGQRFIGPIRIERDLNLEEAILRDLRVFWESVQTGKEPPVDASAGWRQHVSEKMRPSKVVMQADDEMRELIDFWMAQRRKRKKAQEEEDAAKNDILLRMSVAGATGVQLDHETKVSAYKVGGRTDYKAYATDNLPCTAADLAKYKTEGNTWSLRSPKETNDD